MEDNIGFRLDDNGDMYLFEEKILKEYRDKYNNCYYLTKGFRYYYLYKKNFNSTFATVAEGKINISKYIKENNLKEVEL